MWMVTLPTPEPRVPCRVIRPDGEIAVVLDNFARSP